MGLAFAHKISNGRNRDQDLENGDAALSIEALHQILRDDPEQVRRHLLTNLLLLMRWKDIGILLNI